MVRFVSGHTGELELYMVKELGVESQVGVLHEVVKVRVELGQPGDGRGCCELHVFLYYRRNESQMKCDGRE